MSIGDFLSGGIGQFFERGGFMLAPAVNGFLSAQRGVESLVNARNQAASGDLRAQDYLNAATTMAMTPLAAKALETGIKVPGVNAVFQALAVAPRSINTALISAQHADAASGTNGGTDWGEFFNKETWARAWEMSEFGSPDAVTSGQIVFGVNNTTRELDPFKAADAALIQKNANSTWYGSTATAMTDLGLSFIAPPGMGQLAKVRAATGARTIVEVDEAATRFNEAGVVGRTPAQKVKDAALHLSVPNGAANVDARVAEQVRDLTKAFDGKLDEGEVFNQVKARIPLAPDGQVTTVTNLLVDINKSHADPAVREQLRTNLFYAVQGSETAKTAFLTQAPLLAKNFQGLTSVPREYGAFTDYYQMRLNGPDFPLNDLIEQHWGTTADKVELRAMGEHILKKKNALKEHNQLVADINALKPRIHETPEARHIQSRRAEKHADVQRLKGELGKAKTDLHGTRRWAAGAVKEGKGVGVTQNAQDFHIALGDARRRVDDLQAELDNARSDRNLLDSTPLHDPTALEEWQATIGEAKLLRSGARDALDAAKADKAGLEDLFRQKEREIAHVRPYLDGQANARINEILDVAGPNSDMAALGATSPTVLSRLKAHIRDSIGDYEIITAGKGNVMVKMQSLPTRTARYLTAPVARGSIALNEIGVGARQLTDTMSRAKVFTPEEVRATRNALIRAQPADRAGVIARVQDDMVQRMAVDWFKDRMPDLTPEEALARAKDISDFTLRAWGEGNKWITKGAAEQADSPIVFIRDAEGNAVGFEGPTLRSQLADSAPIIDPWDFHRAMRADEHTFITNTKNGMHVLANAHDFGIAIWKTGTLIRPGLAVRAMLDTGPRTLASLTALDSILAVKNGSRNVLHNRAGSAFGRVTGKPQDEIAANRRYLQTTKITLGGHEFQVSKDAADVSVTNLAATKGATTTDAVMSEMTGAYSHYVMDRNSWVYPSPDSTKWHVGYHEYAQVLIASPTARKVAELNFRVDDTASMAKLFSDLKDSPQFGAEYRVLAQPLGLSRSMWLQQLVRETSAMFPTERLYRAAKNNGLSQKLIDREFPREARFQVPSPEMSALKAYDVRQVGTKVLNKAFRTLLDKPDMWIGRNPVVVQVFNRRAKMEYAALEAKHGPGYLLSEREAAMVQRRAKEASIGYVRQTFFDTTRYTPLHRSVARFSPFVGAWEDAMISWGRLIYDDPRRLVKLSAAYHSPYTVATSTGKSIVLDQDGNPLPRGKEADGVFVAIPLGALGRKLGVPYYRMRLDAINSIAQGETWWLPGVGPSVSVPLTFALGSDKVIPRETALELIDTDNPIGKAMLKSVFLGGEIPASDPASMFKSTLPGYVRIMSTELLGTGKLNTQLTQYNYLLGQQWEQGKDPNQAQKAKLWEEAGNTAIAGGAIRLAASAGFGFTGTAAVDGQFYADQQNIIYAMTDEQRGGLTAQEYFAKMYPEAGGLKYSFTKNESGIVASVNAAKAEAKLDPLLKQYPAEFGWMILGQDNMVDPQFSRSAYNMQKSDKRRTYQSPDDVKTAADSAYGWKLFSSWSQQVEDSLVAQGADPDTVRSSNAYLEARRKIKTYLMQSNAGFNVSANTSSGNFVKNYNQAKSFSTSGPIKDRADMASFREYDKARTAVMDKFGIKSFDGASQAYVDAKAAMVQIGAIQSTNNLGFQQMWDRFLGSEFE